LAIRWLIGPLWAGWERSAYLRHYRTLKRRQFDDPVTIRARQWAALRAIARHAYATVPFYRRRFDRAGLHPGDLHAIDDFRRLPILTKADIRAHAARLRSDQFPPEKLRRLTTSGSTGVSLELWADEPSMQWKRACTLRADEWSGWRFGEATARVWGNPEYLRHGWRGRLRNRLLDRADYLDTLQMNAASLERFAQRLKRRQPPLLFGHAHSVYLLATFMGPQGPRGYHPRGIITTAMILHDWQRRAIEAAFGQPVTNRYGCEEVSLIACECARHDGLHVNADNVFVEILRDGQPARPGEAGSVIVTDLTNRAMPVLRYQVGDVAVASDRLCPCGRGLPLIERIEGREADYVTTPRGDLISGISLTENFAVQVPGLAQLQIVQEAVDRFRFRIVRGADFGPASEARIADLVAERFGGGLDYVCEYVDQIPQEPSGKYRFCISKVENPFTQAARVAT
jgi:phenylacetate-CoA ligase